MTIRASEQYAAINSVRLIDRHRQMAAIGATDRGGVKRLALTAEDTEARRLLLSWSSARGYRAEIDPIGNLFVTRRGRQPHLEPVMTGSHLDTQPTGGNFDGIFGVLAGLEILETLDDKGILTERSIELVVWINEEGARFAPVTMGSAVSAGALSLQTALDTIDTKGISVRQALEAHMASLPAVGIRPLGTKGAAFIEAHIEQGPVLEAEARQIGVVTGIQGICAIEVEIVGFEAHAGTTPSRKRRDAFVAALALIGKIRSTLHDPTDVLRFTVGRFEVSPGSPNTVPGRVVFTIDLRHPEFDHLSRACESITDLSRGTIEGCEVRSRVLLRSDPVRFAPRIIEAIQCAASGRDIPYITMVSGATHDARYASLSMPTGMLFIPCESGISHNEAENVRDEDLIVGAQVLLDTLVALATARD